MKPKVLKTGRDHKAALACVERLLAQPAPDEDELELWSLLIEKYEEDHFPIAAPDPIEAIRFRMDQAGLQPAGLRPFLQSKSKVSEVMNRKRSLSLRMIPPKSWCRNPPLPIWCIERPAPNGDRRFNPEPRRALRKGILGLEQERGDIKALTPMT
jgi:antitoxin component HigA of HigAB toxin-antitoxin module